MGRLIKGLSGSMTRSLIAVLVIVLLFAACGGLLAWGIGWRKNAKLQEGNYSALFIAHQKQGDGFALAQQLTKQQFDARVGGLLDSLKNLTKENIKLRHVNSLTMIELRKERENIKSLTRDSLIPGDTIRLGRLAMVMDSCLKVDVFIPDTGDVVYFSTKLRMKANLIMYEGKRRRQVKLLGLNLFRVGSRHTSAQLVTNCDSAKVDVQHIERIKK